ncbi:hypothetical protein RND81_11G168300 [Saponaria officinalis]|uniref:Uncharacterized protein n=1 Tax=Saponaria officinalis TaxID=3572 RepID=A0AAW1HP41_SAPOF
MQYQGPQTQGYPPYTYPQHPPPSNCGYPPYYSWGYPTPYNAFPGSIFNTGVNSTGSGTPINNNGDVKHDEKLGGTDNTGKINGNRHGHHVSGDVTLGNIGGA